MSLCWVALGGNLSTRCRVAGNPPRRAGNFSLTRQRKVTKRGALNRTPAPHALAAHCNNRTASGTTRTAALSLLSLSPASRMAPSGRLTRGCTPGSRGIPKAASLGRRDGAMARGSCVGWGEHSEPQRAAYPLWRRPSDAVFPGEPGVQPALTGVKGRWMAIFIGTAARAKRFASGCDVSARFRAPLVAAWRWFAVQRLFFGDFLLAPQKKTEGFGEAKVTPPPGGTPGNAPSRHALHQSNRTTTLTRRQTP